MSNVELLLLLDKEIEELKQFESEMAKIFDDISDITEQSLPGMPSDESKNDFMNNHIRNGVRMAFQSKPKLKF